MISKNPLINTVSGIAYANFIAMPSNRELTDIPMRSYKTMTDDEVFIAACKDIVRYKEIVDLLEVELPLFKPKRIDMELLLKFVKGYKKQTPYRDIRDIISQKLAEYVYRPEFEIGNIVLTKPTYERMKKMTEGN